MQDVYFGRWHLASDPEATRAAYATMSLALAEWSSWDSGRNFAQALDQGLVWTDAVTALLEQLGIDCQRDAEIYHIARLDSGLHEYGGFFHFVGQIVSGRDAAVPVAPGAWHYDLEQVSATIALGFTALIDLLEPAFKDHPVVQLQIDAKVPWVLDEPEPA